MSDSSDKKASDLITGTVLIALVSAYIYIITFLYEQGYCSFFGIPPTLINPNFTTSLMIGAKLIVLILSSLVWIDLVPRALRKVDELKKSPKISHNIFSLILLTIIIALISWYVTKIWWIALFVGIILFVAAGAVVFLPLFFCIGKSNSEKRKALDNWLVPENNPVFVDKILWSFFPEKRTIIFIIVLMGFTGVASILGYSEAWNQSQFLFLKSQENYAVVRIYGDLMIAVEIDHTTKRVGKNILLIKMANTDKFEFKKEIIGQLEQPLFRAEKDDATFKKQ